MKSLARTGRAIACSVVVSVAMLSGAPTALAQSVSPATPAVLAQSDPNGQQSSTSRSSARGTRGLVKLGIGAVVLGIAGVGWIIRRVKGGDDK